MENTKDLIIEITEIEIFNEVGRLEALFAKREKCNDERLKEIYNDKIEKTFKRQAELLADYNILTLEF